MNVCAVSICSEVKQCITHNASTIPQENVTTEAQVTREHLPTSLTTKAYGHGKKASSSSSSNGNETGRKRSIWSIQEEEAYVVLCV